MGAARYAGGGDARTSFGVPDCVTDWKSAAMGVRWRSAVWCMVGLDVADG